MQPHWQHTSVDHSMDSSGNSGNNSGNSVCPHHDLSTWRFLTLHVIAESFKFKKRLPVGLSGNIPYSHTVRPVRRRQAPTYPEGNQHPLPRPIAVDPAACVQLENQTVIFASSMCRPGLFRPTPQRLRRAHDVRPVRGSGRTSCAAHRGERRTAVLTLRPGRPVRAPPAAAGARTRRPARAVAWSPARAPHAPAWHRSESPVPHRDRRIG